MTKEAGAYNGAKTASSKNGVGRSGQLHAKKMKLDHQLKQYTKINSRWIKDLNISRNTIKVLEENIGRKISHIPCIFTDMPPKARDIKERVIKWDLIKIKSFCMAQENSTKLKQNQQYGKTYLLMIPQKGA